LRERGMKVEVRELRKEDLPAYRVVYTVGYYYSIYRKWLLKGLMESWCAPPKDARCLLALAEGSPAGLIVYRARGDKVDIEELAVIPEYRRRGVARALVEKLAEVAKGMGAREIQATVPCGQFEGDPKLGELLEAYRRLGFTLEGISLWVECRDRPPVEALDERGSRLLVYESSLRELSKLSVEYRVVEEWGRNYTLVRRVSSTR